ncbi:GNAT family N-acetyltransferase [Agrococcus jejuensis]|uniref:GNAT family N-acetyltransferase n=1 Tax=Agrococcus jejuensis TaxID=399736 RepID=UPI0021B6C4D3|nr:GNAT family N-acetyltransferase [Agrococcus jejuensis]
MTIVLRPMDPSDWAAVERIYADGIASGLATFEAATPDRDAFLASRVAGLSSVAVDDDGAIVGWVAASQVSARAVYRGVVEHSVYVAQGEHGRGIGGMLLRRLIADADALGIWTIQSAIFPENVGSIRLHERAGFRVVGTRERIAQMPDGTWRDTVLMERRSAVG